MKISEIKVGIYVAKSLTIYFKVIEINKQTKFLVNVSFYNRNIKAYIHQRKVYKYYLLASSLHIVYYSQKYSQ